MTVSTSSSAKAPATPTKDSSSSYSLRSSTSSPVSHKSLLAVSEAPSTKRRRGADLGDEATPKRAISTSAVATAAGSTPLSAQRVNRRLNQLLEGEQGQRASSPSKSTPVRNPIASLVQFSAIACSPLSASAMLPSDAFASIVSGQSVISQDKENGEPGSTAAQQKKEAMRTKASGTEEDVVNTSKTTDSVVKPNAPATTATMDFDVSSAISSTTISPSQTHPAIPVPSSTAPVEPAITINSDASTNPKRKRGSISPSPRKQVDTEPNPNPTTISMPLLSASSGGETSNVGEKSQSPESQPLALTTGTPGQSAQAALADSMPTTPHSACRASAKEGLNLSAPVASGVVGTSVASTVTSGSTSAASNGPPNSVTSNQQQPRSSNTGGIVQGISTTSTSSLESAPVPRNAAPPATAATASSATAATAVVKPLNRSSYCMVTHVNHATGEFFRVVKKDQETKKYRKLSSVLTNENKCRANLLTEQDFVAMHQKSSLRRTLEEFKATLNMPYSLARFLVKDLNVIYSYVYSKFGITERLYGHYKEGI
ncbi:hypothetical protein HDV05_007911, partial [Chytridiales sp. JEL 0842]